MTHDVAQDILSRALNNDEGGEDGIPRDYKSLDSSTSFEDGDFCHGATICADNGDENDDADGGYILSGECELCEREMKLTRHHLIPKRTWKNIAPRFLLAAPFVERGDMESAYRELDLGDYFQLPTTKTGTTRGIFSSRL